MCLAIPGKIIQIENDTAIVDYGSEKREAKIFEGNFSIGDYVIVQSKLIIEKVPEDQAISWIKAFNENGS